MTQMIGVTYLYLPITIPTPAGSVDVLDAWHLALFYDDGAGNKKVIEAVPQNKFPDQVSVGQALGEAAKEQWSMTNENDGSPFGLIVGDPQAVRDWNANDDKLPHETLLQSEGSLSSTWNAIVQDAIQKLAEGYEYRPLQQNSNTFVGTLLRDASFKQMPTGAPIGMAYIPGLDNTLHAPIGKRSDLPSSLGATDFAFSNPDPNTTSIVIGDPTYETIQWKSGQVSVTLNGQPSIFEPYDVTSVTSTNGHVVLIGPSGGATFDGNGSDCLMLGGREAIRSSLGTAEMIGSTVAPETIRSSIRNRRTRTPSLCRHRIVWTAVATTKSSESRTM